MVLWLAGKQAAALSNSSDSRASTRRSVCLTEASTEYVVSSRSCSACFSANPGEACCRLANVSTMEAARAFLLTLTCRQVEATGECHVTANALLEATFKKSASFLQGLIQRTLSQQ